MAANLGVTLGYTPGGKRVFARPMFNRSIHEIVMEGGGIMPDRLKGNFAGLAQCQAAFEEWLKEKENPKPKITKRGKRAELSEDSDV